ncbi:hypothetical protein FRC07_010931 [Ceratobasidium sp. 392]|nr:hypothetical protein FRC07_010931 [Ceratobasidium sp. 392]
MRVSFAVLALAAVASASSVFRRQSMPACAMTCIMNANTQDSGCDATDNTCLCKNQAFIQSTSTCIASTCQGNDLKDANEAASALCAAAGVTLTPTDPSATETAPAETSAPVETSEAAPSQTTVAGSSSAPATGSSPATGSASHTSAAATSRATGSATGSAAPTASSPASNGAVGPAGVSGMVGALAAVAGFMFAL